MIYAQKEPIEELSEVVKCFWWIDGEGSDSIRVEKIIPDGYPEMIFHYRNPYQANINGSWKLQSPCLLAGQIRNHFLLKNTGQIGMFAIKFQPWALRKLFGINMSDLTDQVVPVDEVLPHKFDEIKRIAICALPFETKVQAMERYLLALPSANKSKITKGEQAVRLMIEKKGCISIQDIQDQINISERSLERYFKNHIGLTPKFYSRVIRFSSIFALVQENPINWADVTYLAGFYDQAHFIKNFKEFTGEEPSKYRFSEQNMANFFLS